MTPLKLYFLVKICSNNLNDFSGFSTDDILNRASRWWRLSLCCATEHVSHPSCQQPPVSGCLSASSVLINKDREHTCSVTSASPLDLMRTRSGTETAASSVRESVFIHCSDFYTLKNKASLLHQWFHKRTFTSILFIPATGSLDYFRKASLDFKKNGLF